MFDNILLVYYIHLGLVLVLIVGGFILPVHHLPYYILFILLVFLDWNDMDGMCILTKIEYYLRHGVWIHDISTYEPPKDRQEDSTFFRRSIESVFPIKLNDDYATRINYLLFLIPTIVALMRYWRYTHTIKDEGIRHTTKRINTNPRK